MTKLVRSTLLVAAPAIVVLAVVFMIGRTSQADAALDLSGGWTFIITGDFEGTCPVTLAQTGEDITGDFDCPGSSDDGTLQGTVELQDQRHVLVATITIHEGTVVRDVWDIRAEISPAGNNVSGQWEGTNSDSGSMTGSRDVPSYIEGDLNCDGLVDGLDVLTDARWTVDFNPLQEPFCPEIGSDIGVTFGDTDCNALTDFGDAMPILRYAAGLPASLPTGCLAIGEKYTAPQAGSTHASNLDAHVKVAG